MIVKNSAGHSCCMSILHPHDPSLVVFERNAQEESFSAVLIKSSSPSGLFVDQCFHANWNERCCIGVVLAIHIWVYAEVFGLTLD